MVFDSFRIAESGGGGCYVYAAFRNGEVAPVMAGPFQDRAAAQAAIEAASDVSGSGKRRRRNG